MRPYDRNQPLIIIHLPKTAGTSTEKYFRRWYGEGFLKHAFNPRTGDRPSKYDLFEMHTPDNPIMLHGHFNKMRNLGIEDYYPNVNQFVTILREPFERAVSGYFYIRSVESDWQGEALIPEANIADYIMREKTNIFNHFPKEVTESNYKELIEKYFIEIGITEHLHESMGRIAAKLGFEYGQTELVHHNATKRDQSVPSYLKDIFMEKHQLEYTVYNYILQRYS